MQKKSSARFFHAGSQGWLYFDANSIGAMPRIARILAIEAGATGGGQA